MAGGIVIAVILVLFPVLVGLGSVVATAAFGWTLKADAETRHAGSELVDLNT